MQRETVVRNAKRLLISVIATALSSALQYVIKPWHDVPFLVYFGAVVIVARYFGYTSAAWTSVLSAAVADYIFLQPRAAWSVSSDDLAKIFGFLFISAIIVAIARERRHAEKKLRGSLFETQLSLERLERAQEVGRVASWELDLRTGQVSWSEYAQRVFEGSRLTRSVDEFLTRLHPDDLPRVQASLKDIGSVTQSMEYRIRNDQGDYRWYQTRTMPVGDRVLGATVDIEDRKQAEKALIATEKLAAAGRLAATIAHEINNPLEAVSNLLYLSLQSKLDDETRSYLVRAEGELERVSHIAKQTLGFYRGSTLPRPVRVAQLAQETIELYRRRAEARRIFLQCESRTDALVLAPEGELKQVLSNLISNAIDASESGAGIRVRVLSSAGRVRILVCDQGHGIPDAVRRRIFEPFFTTKKDVGTGLGLWVSKGLVESLGGTLRFCTSPNGTVFRVSLESYRA